MLQIRSRKHNENVAKVVARLQHSARFYDKLAAQALDAEKPIVRDGWLESEQCRNQARFYRELAALLVTD